MNNQPVISFVLYGHAPFVCHSKRAPSPQEHWLFESISETYIPLLGVFDRLDRDHIPFRMGLSLSPILCHMLTDEVIIKHYLEYVDRQIEFGVREMERSSGNPEQNHLVRYFHDQIVEKRILFTERYECNILKGFDYYQKKGRLEILTTAATHAFLPFYSDYSEAVQAQFEVAISSYRSNFGKYPHGFWLPEMGWNNDLDSWLRSYNFSYTIVDTHGLIFARPQAKRGSFFPARTPQGTIIFGRDFYAPELIKNQMRDPAYRYNRRDQGYELPLDDVRPFLEYHDSRTPTGYKYWANGNDGLGKDLYNIEKAAQHAAANACTFLDNVHARFKQAADLMDDCPVSLCAFNADHFGRLWYEGHHFFESLFREGTKRGDLQFLTPSEYLCKLDAGDLQTLSPEFSSSGVNGYAETWLDASNDWMYRHIMHALERMVEIAERFPDSSGLKERALNQASREILLVLASDWAKMLYKQEFADYAHSRIESSLRNFTTIYEALGSNYISTEWLTQLEKKHNVFPNINYRVFRRKR